MISPLEPPDIHHLSAAQGWLALGCVEESKGELAKIAEEQKGHPLVLMGWWDIHSHGKNWVEALKITERLLKLIPEEAYGYIQHAFALHEIKRTVEARDFLMAVVDRFPENSTIYYNLGCYTCQLGDIEEAKQWLRKAIAVSSEEDIRAMAMQDSDFEPLRAIYGDPLGWLKPGTTGED